MKDHALRNSFIHAQIPSYKIQEPIRHMIININYEQINEELNYWWYWLIVDIIFDIYWLTIKIFYLNGV